MAMALTKTMNEVKLLPKYRVDSIDYLRGLVLCIMVLDHVRDFWHINAWVVDATDLEETNLQLFFTRWITHFCAPVFVFLAGASARLVVSRSARSALTGYFFKRGLVLIALELTLVWFAWRFHFNVQGYYLGVIWVIGICFLWLSVAWRWGPKVILIIGAVIMLGHNALDVIQLQSDHLAYELWAALHQQGRGYLFGLSFFFHYPILPWVGVASLGYGFSYYFFDAAGPRLPMKYLAYVGGAAVLLFIILRPLNAYFDPMPMDHSQQGAWWVASFLNTQKYGPSLLYTLMTLGPAVLLLYAMEVWGLVLPAFLKVFGKVSMFFYLSHLFLAHGLVGPGKLLGVGMQVENEAAAFNFGEGNGVPLWQVYVVWFIVLVLLYPLCRWYGGLKKRYPRNVWLRYV